MSETKKMFISHKGEDEDKIDDFKNMMERKGYIIKDSSIRESDPNNAHNPDYIKSKYLGPSISWAGTFIVLIGDNTHTSDWVNWEIEYAHKLDKTIIGVFIRGESDAILPKAFAQYGDKCVKWNSDKIDRAIQTNEALWEVDNDNNILPRSTC